MQPTIDAIAFSGELAIVASVDEITNCHLNVAQFLRCIDVAAVVRDVCQFANVLVELVDVVVVVHVAVVLLLLT